MGEGEDGSSNFQLICRCKHDVGILTKFILLLEANINHVNRDFLLEKILVIVTVSKCIQNKVHSCLKHINIKYLEKLRAVVKSFSHQIHLYV